MGLFCKAACFACAKLRKIFGFSVLGLASCFTLLPPTVRGENSAEDLLEKARSVGESHKDSAIVYLLKAAEVYGLEEDFAGQASTFNVIGNTYLHMHNSSKAIEYYIASAEIYKEKANNRQMYGRNLINIAMIKLNIGDPVQAMDYAQPGQTPCYPG